MEIRDCDDNAKVQTDGTNRHGPVLVENSWICNAWGGHGDNFQNVTFDANDSITIPRNSIERWRDIGDVALQHPHGNAGEGLDRIGLVGTVRDGFVM